MKSIVLTTIISHLFCRLRSGVVSIAVAAICPDFAAGWAVSVHRPGLQIHTDTAGHVQTNRSGCQLCLSARIDKGV